MSTEKNLDTAFAGEAQAVVEYTAFAAAAEEEGYPNVAKLFRATAESARLYANFYLETLATTKSATENLQTAIAGELQKANELFPGFVMEAKTDADSNAMRLFMLTKAAQKLHVKLFEQAAAKLASKEPVDYYLCSLCGHIQSVVPVVCPICGLSSKAYKKID